MTSNIGAQYIQRMEHMGFNASGGEEKSVHDMDKASYDEVKGKVMESLRDYFRPEFLNRVDDIILFDILSKEAIEKIVAIQMQVVVDRLHSKDINLAVSSEVFAYLAKEGYNPQYGARPLKRLIQTKILTHVASLMISQGITKGGTINVSMKDGQIAISASKKKKGESPIIINQAELMQ
jgi:ATP-dependent Clp protease ATP-binding subunit ClpC